MYKKQMVVQKILCFAALIIGAIIFVYSLGIMTDLYEALYPVRNSADPEKTKVAGTIVYYNMQGFNKQFLLAGIGMILLGVLLFITNTHVRRKYYIGNYVSVAAYSAAGLVLTVWAHAQIEYYKAQFLQVDFEALKAYAEDWKTYYTDSTFWFDIHYLVFGLLVVIIIALIANVFWKRSLMKAEQELINRGKEAAAS
ncbi:MAG: hypothetical protein Q4E57_01585 [Eubacteriales bacterium]|nr:hypothetical protein [Eubacteriales bacterium]